MPASNRTTLLFLTAAFVLAAASVAARGWQFTTQTEVNTRPPSQLVQHPGKQALILQARIDAKLEVINRLLANDLTLLEAAAWFRHLNENPPEYPSATPVEIPGKTINERVCRQVVTWAITALRGQMPESQSELITCSLEAELNELLARDGDIELPW